MRILTIVVVVAVVFGFACTQPGPDQIIQEEDTIDLDGDLVSVADGNLRNIKPKKKHMDERERSVLSATCEFLDSGDEDALRTILSTNDGEPTRYRGIADLAEYVLHQRLPTLDLERARLEFLRDDPLRFRSCIAVRDPASCEIQQNSGQTQETKIWSSELYAEGLFKLVRGRATNLDDLGAEVAPLGLRPGEIVADIGFGSGEFSIAMAREVGAGGQVIGVEISPALVDFLNHASVTLELPQMEARLGGNSDIRIAADSLDAVFIRRIFSNLRSGVQPWVDTIFAAVKPGGRVLILQHYSPEKVAESRVIIGQFLDGGPLLATTETLPCLTMSPEVISMLCRRSGFEIESVRENVAPEHVFELIVRRPPESAS
jgi:SAM-dependent methyltransferase